MEKGRCTCKAVPKLGAALNNKNIIGFITGILPGYFRRFSSKVWTDSTNLYWSSTGERNSGNFILSISSYSTSWDRKSWTGLTHFDAEYIWTDGANIYYSEGSKQYVKNGDSWDGKVWTSLSAFDGMDVWSDGVDIFYSAEGKTYKLRSNSNMWQEITYTLDENLKTSLSGRNIWTDGVDIYHSNGKTYKLSGATWTECVWADIPELYNKYIWTDGIHIYYSDGNAHYKFESANWQSITWTGFNDFSGEHIYCKGKNIYYIDGDKRYVMLTAGAKLSRNKYGGSSWHDPWPMFGGNTL